MRRIRDYNISRVLEQITKKKTEYILDEDLARIDTLVIKNIEDGIRVFKDLADLEFLGKLAGNLYIEFEGFDLTGLKLTFNNTIQKMVIKNCKIDDLVINVTCETEGFELVLSKIKTENGIRLEKQMPLCNKLTVIGKATTQLTRQYTVQQITENMKKEVPNYSELDDGTRVELLKKQGYLTVYPQKIDITGIDKLKLINSITLEYMEINEINFSEITKYSKKARVLDYIKFYYCTFNEAPVLYKQPVKRLVIDSCNVKRKSLLPNFVQVGAIEVVNTKGMEIPKLNEPKILKAVKFVDSEVNLKGITKLKKLETVIVLGQELENIAFVKKLKKLKYLVVTKDSVKDISVIEKMKKIQFVQIEKDDLNAEYNEHFV